MTNPFQGGKHGTRYLLEQDDRKELWKGTCVLNAESRGLESIHFGEKGTMRMTFTVECQGGHGAYLHLNEGAIRIASRLINRLTALEDLRGEGMESALKEYLARPDVRRVADRIMGTGAADSMLKPTVNIGTIKGGAKVNMIPSSCIFEADIRLPIGLQAETVLAKIDSILREFRGASYKIQEAATNPAAASSIGHEMVHLIQSNAKAVSGTEPLPIVSMGATDCKHFRYHGTPAYTYGPSPETMAQREERVCVKELLETVKVHTLAAWDYLSESTA
jgi:succinyl-diaminopimelate desuccinylase